MASELSGILLVNKPTGISSHDAVLRARRATKQRRIGHCGTLDPMAEGLLVLCLGRATKLARLLSGHDKTYEAVVRLGHDSPTYDSEGVREIPDTTPVLLPDVDVISKQLDLFRGEIEQKVPAFSAVSVDGERLYSRARRGQPTPDVVRRVTIHELTVLDYRLPDLQLKVRCSAGAYIRSLAHDIGVLLGCGAYLAELKRTRSGPLRLEDALDLEMLDLLGSRPEADWPVLRPEDAIDLSAMVVSERGAAAVRHGVDLKGPDVVRVLGDFALGQQIVLKDVQGRILAIGQAMVPSAAVLSGTGSVFRYGRVLA